ncbi:14-3-3-like protein B [Rosa sericea]
MEYSLWLYDYNTLNSPNSSYLRSTMGFATEREKLVYTAKLAQEAERYDEMVDAMKMVANLDVELTLEERSYLSFGYKNVVDARRSSWRILSSTEQTEEAKGNNIHMKHLKKYRQRVESEISIICRDIISVLDSHLIPSTSDGESTVHYHKMKGDFYRYLAEIKAGDEKEEAIKQSKKAYYKALTVAEAELPPTNPIRLGAALHLSILYHEFLNNPETACRLTKIAFEEGTAEINALNNEPYKNTLMALKLLRENYSLWTSQLPH